MQNFLREEVGPRVDFYKFRGLVCKMAGKRKIRAVRPADPTAGKSWRRGLLPCSRNWPRIVGRDMLLRDCLQLRPAPASAARFYSSILQCVFCTVLACLLNCEIFFMYCLKMFWPKCLKKQLFFFGREKKEESSFFSGNGPRSMDQPQNPKWAKSRPVKVLESMLGRYLFC